MKIFSFSRESINLLRNLLKTNSLKHRVHLITPFGVCFFAF